METKPIDNKATCEAIRESCYGSVLEFCRQAKVDAPFFYMIVGGKRPPGKRGPTPVRTNELLDRLEREGLLVRQKVVNA